MSETKKTKKTEDPTTLDSHAGSEDNGQTTTEDSHAGSEPADYTTQDSHAGSEPAN
ncbi:hypothetical protein [Streptomyces sp. NPDC048436]|uniref:hypothetical protein n=1 Tax=Streptomyces sp. NPDC048436 TaxID=3365550 RepID=UPI00371D9FFA